MESKTRFETKYKPFSPEERRLWAQMVNTPCPDTKFWYFIARGTPPTNLQEFVEQAAYTALISRETEFPAEPISLQPTPTVSYLHVGPAQAYGGLSGLVRRHTEVALEALGDKKGTHTIDSGVHELTRDLPPIVMHFGPSSSPLMIAAWSDSIRRLRAPQSGHEYIGIPDRFSVAGLDTAALNGATYHTLLRTLEEAGLQPQLTGFAGQTLQEQEAMLLGQFDRTSARYQLERLKEKVAHLDDPSHDAAYWALTGPERIAAQRPTPVSVGVVCTHPLLGENGTLPGLLTITAGSRLANADGTPVLSAAYNPDRWVQAVEASSLAGAPIHWLRAEVTPNRPIAPFDQPRQLLGLYQQARTLFDSLGL